MVKWLSLSAPPGPDCYVTVDHVILVSQLYKWQEENVSDYLLLNFSAVAQDNEENQTTVSYLSILILYLFRSL